MTRRPDISMSAAEVDAFLARALRMVVGAIGPDGWPVGTLGATRYEDGRLAVEFAPHDPVAAALAGDRRACLVWDEHASYSEIRGVIVHGTVAGDPAGEVAIERTISFDFARIQPPPPGTGDQRR